MNMGCLYWITGLSCAGKTTLAKRLFLDLKKEKSNVVLLDGDSLREVYGLDGHYSFSDRLEMATRHARMCHLLTTQNIDVICPTISMFHEVRAWNKKHQANYIEIFLDVSAETLSARDKLNLYSNCRDQQKDEVVGLTVEAELPQTPDIVLNNEGDSGIEEIYQQLKGYLHERPWKS